MDYRGRRNRRRNHSRTNETNQHALQNTKPWSLLSGLYSFMIMTSLLGVIYLMLEHHCKTCSARCDLGNITKNINDISKNLSLMKDSYYDLEKKIFKFSQDLPKIEGQIDILEALANTVDNRGFGCPKIMTVPKFDVDLKNIPENICNVTAKYVKNSFKPIVNQE